MVVGTPRTKTAGVVARHDRREMREASMRTRSDGDFGEANLTSRGSGCQLGPPGVRARPSTL
jgi:hypothetical protein